MSASCSSSTHSAPPPTATSSPRSLPELTSAMSTMEIDTEHNSSQSNTEISNIGVPGRESLQLKNGTQAPQASLSGYYLSNNYSFPPDPRTAESFRIQRFLEDEDQNRMSSLALDNTPPSTILTFCTPRTEIFQGLRKKRTKRKRSAHAASKKKVKRGNRATEASSVHAKVGSLPAEDRFAREFGEEQFESGRKWFVGDIIPGGHLSPILVDEIYAAMITNPMNNMSTVLAKCIR
ncbi:hypothetical protein HOY82DRAFT_541782 [Tuber indicum]|nr:hypothetical protein HOY82DRAFT_541782 [Tuber indicum]